MAVRTGAGGSPISRRQMLKSAAASAGKLLLASCGAGPAATPSWRLQRSKQDSGSLVRGSSTLLVLGFG